MEQIYIILGQIVFGFLIVTLFAVILFIFWNWNVKKYTWLFQIYDWYMFKKVMKSPDFEIKSIDDMIEIFSTKNTKFGDGLFSKKAVKLLKEYKNNLNK